MTPSDKECESYARECVRLANLTNDSHIHDALMQMARDWMAVAMHENKMPSSTDAMQAAGAAQPGLREAQRPSAA
jgi:hypothetical protein